MPNGLVALQLHEKLWLDSFMLVQVPPLRVTPLAEAPCPLHNTPADPRARCRDHKTCTCSPTQRALVKAALAAIETKRQNARWADAFGSTTQRPEGRFRLCRKCNQLMNGHVCPFASRRALVIKEPRKVRPIPEGSRVWVQVDLTAIARGESVSIDAKLAIAVCLACAGKHVHKAHLCGLRTLSQVDLFKQVVTHTLSYSSTLTCCICIAFALSLFRRRPAMLHPRQV